MLPVKKQDISKEVKVQESNENEELGDEQTGEKGKQNVNDKKEEKEISSDVKNTGTSLMEYEGTTMEESEEEESVETTEIRKIFAEHLSPIIAEKANSNKMERMKKKQKNKSIREGVSSEMEVESDNETTDSESSGALHIDQTNEEEDMETILEEKATKNNLTAANVKSILHQVITNKDVVNMVKNTLTSIVNAGGSLGGVYEPKMTRAKTKEVIEQGKVPEVWTLTPVKKPTREKPSFLEMQFSDDEDDEYKPEKDKEAMLGDSDEESMLSSHASEFGSPNSLTPSTPALHPSQTSSSSDVFLSPKTPTRHSVRTDLAQTFNQLAENEIEASAEMESADDTIARRTRSRLPLTTTSLLEIESTFVAPDITEDMYDTLCDDKNWQEFLRSLIKTDDAPTQETTDDDNNDPEYDYLGEAEHEERDEEDYRFGKMYRIPKTEIIDLLSQLTEYTASDQEEEDETTKTDTGGETTETDEQKRQRRLSTKTVVDLEFTKSQRLILEDQMRRHVQLSTQLCILCSGSNEYDDVSVECVRHLDELDMFRQASLAGCKSVFNACNLSMALELVKEKRDWDLESELQEIRLHMTEDSSDSESENGTNDYVENRPNAFKRSLLRSQKDIFWNSAVFLYPDILPTRRLLSKSDGTRIIFTPGEDKLIVLGMDQFGTTPRYFYLIQKYLLPPKTRKQIYCRIKNLCRSSAPDNPIKRYRDHKILPEKTVILNTFKLSQMIAPKYQPLHLLPKWCKKFKIELESKLNLESKALEDTLVETFKSRPRILDSDCEEDPSKRYDWFRQKRREKATSKPKGVRKNKERKKPPTKTDLSVYETGSPSIPTAILTSNGHIVPIRFSSPVTIPDSLINLNSNMRKSFVNMKSSSYFYANYVEEWEEKKRKKRAILPAPESEDQQENQLQTEKLILQNPAQKTLQAVSDTSQKPAQKTSVSVGQSSQNLSAGVQNSCTGGKSSSSKKTLVPNTGNVKNRGSGNIPIAPNYSSSGNLVIVPNYSSSTSVALNPNSSGCGNVSAVKRSPSGHVCIAPKIDTSGNILFSPKHSSCGNVTIAPRPTSCGNIQIIPNTAPVVPNLPGSGKTPILQNIVIQNSASPGNTLTVPNYSTSGNIQIVPTSGNFYSVVQTSATGDVSVFQMSGILSDNAADIASPVQVPADVGHVPVIQNTQVENTPIVQVLENGQICIVQNSGGDQVTQVQNSVTGCRPGITEVGLLQNSSISVEQQLLEQLNTPSQCTWSTESFHVVASPMQDCVSSIGGDSQMVPTPSSSCPSLIGYNSTVSNVIGSDPHMVPAPSSSCPSLSEYNSTLVTGSESQMVPVPSSCASLSEYNSTRVTGSDPQMVPAPSSSCASVSEYNSTVSVVDSTPLPSATVTQTFTQDSNPKPDAVSVEPIEVDETNQLPSDSKTIVAVPQNNLSGIVISAPVHSPAISVVHSPMPASLMDTDGKNPDNSDDITPTKLSDQSVNTNESSNVGTMTTMTPPSSCNTSTSTDSSTMNKAVEIMATLAPYYNSYLATPAVTQQEMETTPTKRPRYRELKPKEQTSPDPLQCTSVFKMPDTCLKKSPTPEAKAKKQSRPILPKCVIIEGKISPTKRAANNIKRKAQKLYQKGTSPVKFILPKPLVPESNPEPDPESTIPKVTEPENAQQEDSGTSKSENWNNSATVTTPDTSTGDQETKDEPPAPILRRSKRKAAINKSVETKETSTPRPVVETAPVPDVNKQESEEKKSDEQDDIDELMTASTTIRFNPRKPNLDESGTRKSKAQRKKEIDTAMLAPDILESDPKRDDRDTAFAQAYIQTVREKLLHDPDMYEKFLTMMCDFGKGNQTPIELYQQLCMLFEHYPDLIEDFAGFLRPDEAVACDCFMINQEYQKAVEFLRKVEIYFHRQPTQFQRVLKTFTKWQKTPNHSPDEVRTQIRTLIKNSPILLDEFELFFPEQRVPSSYTSNPDDFEDVDLTGMDIEDEKNFDGFEEVHIPEELDTYRTKRCKCDCHINSNDAKIRAKLKHCYACCLKNVDGGLYFQPSKNKLIPVKVVYHQLPEKYKTKPPSPPPPRPPPAPCSSPLFKSPASTTPIKERYRPPPAPPITTSPPVPSTSTVPSVSPLKQCSLKKAKKMKLKTNKNQKRFLSLNEITSPVKTAAQEAGSKVRETVTATCTLPNTRTDCVNNTKMLTSTSGGILSMPFSTPVLHVPPPPPTFTAPSSTITSGLLNQSCDLEEFSLLTNTSNSSVLVTQSQGESDSMTGAVIRIPDNPLNLDGNISLSNFLDASRSIGLFDLANEVSSKPWLFNENSSSDLLAKAVKAADISVDSNFFRNLMNSPSKSQQLFPSTSSRQDCQQPLSFKGAVEPLTSTEIFTSISEMNSILANQIQTTQAGVNSNIMEPSSTGQPESIFSETSVYMNSAVSTPICEPLVVHTPLCEPVSVHTPICEPVPTPICEPVPAPICEPVPAPICEATPIAICEPGPEELSTSVSGVQNTWTMETDKIILEMCQSHGPVHETFALISQKLVSKTPEEVAGRFQTLMEVLSECHDHDDDDELVEI